MEYSFRNSPDEKEKTIILHVEGIDLHYEGAVYEVPYENINGVWLNKPGGIFTPGEYSCTLNINNQKPIYISSKNYNEHRAPMYQPNNYNSFVRVLHHHLQTKSRAKYRFGIRPRQYLLWICMIIGIFTGCLLTFSLLNINRYLLIAPLLLSVLVAVKGVKFCIANYPKYYTPENIPLNLLPTPVLG